MRRSIAAAGVALLAALAGCGLGPGRGSSAVTLDVTRDFGGRTIGAIAAGSGGGADTVMRLLERSFKITTRYGGGFVQSIGGLAGGTRGGHRYDWFFFVNGVQATKGASDMTLHDGDRVWWDYHDWSAALASPAVIGSFPEPFVHGAGGKRSPTTLSCAPSAAAACSTISAALAAYGVPPARQLLGTGSGQDTIRVLVGPWSALRSDVAAHQLESGPRLSGVYARPDAAGDAIALLDGDGRTVRTLRAGAGLIAATRYQDQQPTWVITGTDTAGVAAAARALTAERLRHRFALAIAPGGGSLALPLQ